jgi:hypothetical protein
MTVSLDPNDSQEQCTDQADEFLRIVLDEAHNIKNRTALVSKACYELKGQRRWALTGTPIVNRLEDLYSLLQVASYCSRLSHTFMPRRPADIIDTSCDSSRGDTTRSFALSSRFPFSTKIPRRSTWYSTFWSRVCSGEKRLCGTRTADSLSTCRQRL